LCCFGSFIGRQNARESRLAKCSPGRESVIFFALKYVLPLEALISELGESLALGACWCVLYFLVMKKSMKEAWNKLNFGGAESADL